LFRLPVRSVQGKGEITGLINTVPFRLLAQLKQSPTTYPYPQTDTTPGAQAISAPILPTDFTVIENRLFYKGIDVLALADETAMPSTTYVRHLPSLRANVAQMHEWFNTAKARTGYPGKLTLAYASKANPSEPVVKTLLGAGTAYECSSAFDIDVMRHAHAQGWIDKDREIFINGFKIPAYARGVLNLRADGFQNITPIFDDLEEIRPFAESGLSFDVGLRYRTASNGEEINRFGMDDDDMAEAADRIAHTDTLRLTTFHAMHTVSASRGLQWMTMAAQSLRSYARLRRIAPSLHRFDIGGGTPARSAEMDHQDWMTQLLTLMIDICAEEGIPVPDLIIESGRYLVQDHAFRLFHVFKKRGTDEGTPYYMIDGSIMSSFPDAWALGDKFTVMPINGWDGEFVAARLAGITCDHDDVYPTHRMADVPLSLPAEIEGLIVGFFDCGAYQETLGGRGGSKHCMLPEGRELILDEDEFGVFVTDARNGQNSHGVLSNLGYSLS
jgi:arginine decarboxylase